MKSRWNIGIAGILAMSALVGGSTAAQGLVPAARLHVEGDGRLRFSSEILVDVEQLAPQAEALADGLRRLGVAQVHVGKSAEGAGEGAVQFTRGELPEGRTYRLHVSACGVVVVVEDSVGAAHAAASLLQLALLDDTGVEWPYLEISDGPDCEFRCFMVDMGRNPHCPSTLRAVVDMCWFYKVNYLQLHLADDQICSWPSRAFPKLLSANAGWTWEDFEALEAYAQARGVAIIPELDVPAHSTILRRNYPEVFGENPEELARNPESRRGLEQLLTEMIAVFQSTPYVHIGGDEAYGVPEELQRDLVNHLHRFVKTLGKRSLVWEGPRLGEGDNKVDEDVVHLNWRTINFPAGEMLAAGYKVVNAAWDPLYVVDHYPRTMFTAVDVKRCFEWDRRVFAHVNPGIPTFARPHRVETTDGILGFCMPWWEGREENLMPLCLPRLAAVSSAAWNREGERDIASFQLRNDRTMSRFRQLAGVPATPMPMASAQTPPGNLAFARPVRVSTGADQPPFVPERLTNGMTDRFDLFLGYPTEPAPLEIVIELADVTEVSKVVVYETAVGGSYELYRVEVSVDGEHFVQVGEAGKGTRGERDHVVHEFPARRAGFVRIVTHGCKDFVFASFSRLTEVQVFE